MHPYVFNLIHRKTVYFFLICTVFTPLHATDKPAIHKKDTIGVTWLTDDIPPQIDYYSNWEIASFKQTGNGYEIVPIEKIKKYRPGVTYHSFLNTATAGNMPEQLKTIADYRENPLIFFRTAISVGNDLQVTIPAFLQGFTTLDMGQNRYSGIIPDSYTDIYKGGLKFSEVKTGKVISEIGIKYIHEDGKYTGRGDGFAWLLSPVYKGESRNRIDQVRELNKDKQHTDELSARVVSKWKKDQMDIQTDISYNRHWDKWNRHIPAASSFAQINRKEDTSDFLFSSLFEYEKKGYHVHSWTAKMIVNYDFRSSTSRLERFYPDKNTPTLKERLTRNAHDISYKLQLDVKQFDVWIANRQYISSTLKSKPLHHLLPEVHFRWNDNGKFTELLNLSPYNDLCITGNISRSLGEVPLIYRNHAVSSTIYKAEEFAGYFYDTDIFFHKNLKPENYLLSDLRLSYNFGIDKNLSIRGFYNTTKNFTVPIYENNNQHIRLQNIGRSHHYGYQIEAMTEQYFGYYNPSFSIKWQFHRSWNRAVSVYSDEPFVKLSGFTDISTVFAQGETVGSIYGSSYKRDTQGNILKDEYGIPLVNTSLKKIGDPNPDFVMTLFPTVNFKNFHLATILEYSHGGDRWNGTSAFLNSYVPEIRFPYPYREGYGPERFGVGEDHIQKATYFRLSEISLLYTLNHYNLRFKFGASIHNVCVITPYKGVDPSSVLYGNPIATGLDLFNQPATRQYCINLTIEL